MVLSALCFLVLALMVTLSFNLSHALRQKMSLQQHSDALAYSMAVLEARALNYYAVSNRAIAGSYVAMNSLHAYMVAASVTSDMMTAGKKNFLGFVVQEIIRCMCKGCQEHCVHAAEAAKIAKEFGDKSDEYGQKVQGLESRFNNAMEGLDLLVDNLHTSQKEVHEQTLKAVKDGKSHGLSQLVEDNSPGASDLNEAVGGLNGNEFNCAVDGLECQGSVGNTDVRARARVMTEVANAGRSKWPADRVPPQGGSKFPQHLHPDFLDELKDIPGEGDAQVTRHVGTAKTVRNKDDVDQGQSSDNEGTTIAAMEEGTLLHRWKHSAVMISKYEAKVWSDAGGGDHEPDNAHSGSHRFEGVNARALTACSQSGNCFMKFRANPSADRDWGQPRVYSYLTKQLRVGDTGRAPWELNPSATVSLRHGAQGEGRLTLAAGEGRSMSKALVYYHRFGDNGWREAPNLFGPYWRAKLHPFKPEEAAKVLEAAGNTDAAEMAQVPGVSL
ncbi:hypothetical protein [Pyxidicoccus fallax]|nr:hypothetical protein [Pyxidicoccus fallax]